MKRIIVIPTLLLILASIAFSQDLKVPPENKTVLAREVFSTVAKWAEAVRTRDTRALDNIFEDYLIVTTHDGKTRGKEEEIGLFRSDPKVRTTRVSNEDMKVRVFGQTALVTALTKIQYLIDKKNVITAFRFTAVFVKEGGRWQLVSLHTARPLPSESASSN